MSDKDIWIIFTKSKVLDGCPIAIDGSDFLFSNIFIPSYSVEDAISQVKQALLEPKLELSDISKCIRYNTNEWSDDSKLSNEINEFSEEAKQSNKIVFGIFRSSESLNFLK